MKSSRIAFLVLAFLVGGWCAWGAPIGTAFDYRGSLQDQGSPANGVYDFKFTLYDASIGGEAVAPVLDRTGVGVADGEFTVRLDFGEQVNTFNGEARWLEVQAKRTNSPTYTTLEPRQPASLTHYALYANYAGGLAADYVYIGKQLEIGDSSPDSQLQINGNSFVYGNSHVEDNLSVKGAVNAMGGLTTTTFKATQAAVFQEGLLVEDGLLEANRGIVSYSGPVTFYGGDGWFVWGAGARCGFDCPVGVSNELVVGGNLILSGYLQGGPGNTNIVVSHALRGSGGVLPISGDLNVSGRTEMSGLQVGGDVGITNDLHVGGFIYGRLFEMPSNKTVKVNSKNNIEYAFLEGPEQGTYVRGSATVTDGEAVIVLPEHFGLVTDESGLTAQITPRGIPLDLYVLSVDTRQLFVREANARSGQFDYFVQGVRKVSESQPSGDDP